MIQHNLKGKNSQLKEEHIQLIKSFKLYLESESKSINTIENYLLTLKLYMIWFEETFDTSLKGIYKPNILSYKNYLLSGPNTDDKTINHHLSVLKKFNSYLCENNLQKEIEINNKMMIRIQSPCISPAKVTDIEVK